MKSCFFLILFSISLTCGAQTYYIVRHAEKVVPAENQVMNLTDPPLNRLGLDRARTLRDSLADKHIGYIFSTNYDRTRSTALPLSELSGVEIKTYAGMPDQAFIDQLKSYDKNVLIVGHSNTVDDIVNALVGEKVLSDLADSEYNNLYVITKTEGKYILEKRKFGK